MNELKCFAAVSHLSVFNLAGEKGRLKLLRKQGCLPRTFWAALFLYESLFRKHYNTKLSRTCLYFAFICDLILIKRFTQVKG